MGEGSGYSALFKVALPQRAAFLLLSVYERVEKFIIKKGHKILAAVVNEKICYKSLPYQAIDFA